MNYSQQPYSRQPKDYWFALKQFFRQKTALSNLILVNLIVFLVVNAVSLTLYLLSIDQEFVALKGVSRLAYWFSIPADLNSLLHRPWTLISYMFLQENLFHLLFNMMVLYIGGRIFTNFMSEKMLVTTYFLGGLSGAFLYVLSFNLFPAFSASLPNAIALGSSASVLAIFVASATRAPNLPMQLFLVGSIPLKYIALIIIALDVLNIRNGNAGGHIAHIGGALYGFLFAWQLKGGKNIGAFFERIPFRNAFNQLLNWFKKPKSNFKNVYTNPRKDTDESYLRRKTEEQARIDHILEKIKKSGYDSLSTDEKELLFRASNKN